MIPLIARDAMVGALGLRFAERRGFGAADRALVATVADLCSQALERARLFRAERAARAAAESANRAKDEFLAMLGHELRNPLAPIVTALQLMKLRGDGARPRSRTSSSGRCSTWSGWSTICSTSRASRAARSSCKKEAVELPTVVAKAVEMASPLLEQRAPRTSPVDVARDGAAARGRRGAARAGGREPAHQRRQVHRAGRAQVAVGAAAERRSCVIRVRDNGIGIAPELLPRVFDLFVQGEQLGRSRRGRARPRADARAQPGGAARRHAWPRQRRARGAAASSWCGCRALPRTEAARANRRRASSADWCAPPSAARRGASWSSTTTRTRPSCSPRSCARSATRSRSRTTGRRRCAARRALPARGRDARHRPAGDGRLRAGAQAARAARRRGPAPASRSPATAKIATRPAARPASTTTWSSPSTSPPC